jgi:hypothetical protein
VHIRPHKLRRSLRLLRARAGQKTLAFLSFLLIGFFVWQLAGCGGSSSGSGNGPSPSPLTVGGTVSGLSGGSVTIINNSIDPLSVTSNGSFKFTLTYSSPGPYSVVIAAQPPGQVCTVTNGDGVVTKTSITNVNVVCAAGPEQRSIRFPVELTAVIRIPD